MGRRMTAIGTLVEPATVSRWALVGGLIAIIGIAGVLVTALG